MIDLQPPDFATIEQFPLAWRFTPDRIGARSGVIRERIRPLTPIRAAAVATDARAQCEHAAGFDVTFRCDESAGVVRARLAALPPSPREKILVSWNDDTALLTDWDLFVAQWDDFCYPASDDVTIWPLDEGWTLCYRRYEILQFRARHS